MPVKSDLNFFSLSPSAMDCDDLSNSGSSGAGCSETLTTTVGAPCDDIWNKFDNFILTPPQSPPVKFDLVSDTLDDELFRDMDTLSSSLSGFTSDCFSSLLSNHNVDVLHDCMWSGQCNEDLFGVSSINGSNSGPGCSANCKLGTRSCGANSCRDGKYRRENCTLLSGSPMSFISCSFSEIYNACGVEEEGRIDDVTRVVEDEEKEDEELEDEDEDEEEVVVSHRHSFGKPSNVFVSSAESLKNDHSYGSPASSPKAALPTVTISTTTTCSTFSNNSNSLILPSSSNKSHHKSRTKERASKQLKSLKVSNEDKSSHITVKFLKRQTCVSPKGAVSNTLDASRRCKLSQSKRTTSTTTTTTGPTSMLPLKLQGSTKQRHSFDDETGTEDGQPSLLIKSTPKSSKSMYPERRREHNDSERKRRDHLRNAFHYLRDQIPKLKDAQKKPARIVILSEATAFVNSLQEKQRYLERTKEAEIRKREKLFKKLNRLQNDCEF